MATLGGGSPAAATQPPSLVDWNTMVKPFVAYSVGSLSRLEVMGLMKAIVESKQDFLDSVARSHPHALFYDVVTVLSAHVLTAAANSDLLQRSSFPAACQVAKLLCESLVARFPHVLKNGHPILTVKTYINVIQEFHTGKLLLEIEEVSTMLALLKNRQLPPKIQSTAPSTWDKEGTVKESRRTRLDPAVLLYDQIALPIINTSFTEPVNVLLAKEVVVNFERLSAGQKLSEACLSLPHLKTLHPEGINIIPDGMKTFYSQVVTKYSTPDLVLLEEELNLVYKMLSMPLFGPLTSSEATELTQLGVSVLYAAFLVIQYFYGGTTSPVSEEDYTLGVGIVSQAIWTEKRIACILKEDTALPQSTWLNFSFVMAKLDLQCVYSYMHHVTITEGKGSGKDGSKGSVPHSVSLSAVQGSWNELITAMSALAISLMQNFVNVHNTSNQPQPPPPVATTTATPSGKDPKEKRQGLSHFKIDQSISSAERLRLFFKTDGACTSSIELLIQLMTLSYRKACCLKVLKYARPGNKPGSSAVGTRTSPEERKTLTLLAPPASSGVGRGSRSSSIATSEGTHNHENEIDVEIEDNQSISDFMTTEDEDEDEEIGDSDEEIEVSGRNGPVEDTDDESIFGNWFESLLVQKPSEEANTRKESREERKVEKSNGDAVEGLVEEFIRDKSCPHGFIESALLTLSFLTRDIITNGISQVQIAVKTSFNEQMMMLIGLVLKDLEKEKCMTEFGAIALVFDDRLNHLFMEFSAEVGKLVQNLIAGETVSPILLSFFLDQLGIDLSGSGRWPMGLQSKSLAVLVQVLLLRPDKDVVVVQILKRVLDTFSIDIGSKTTPLSYADLAVEHAQTLVFLFHTLSLMQKKGILIETANTIIKANEVLGGRIGEDHQLLTLCRLLLLFDYFVRQLYEPDLRLVTQIQYNLFNQETTSWSSGASKPENTKIPDGENSLEPPHSKPLPQARLYYDCIEVMEAEDTMDSSHPIPFVYNLIATEPNYQETPKLDGLSMNFLMNKSEGKDRADYFELISALFGLMEAEIMDGRDEGGIHYLEYFLTRIFFSLPPPIEFLDSLSNPALETEGHALLARFPAVLYLLVWAPRLSHRHFASWVRDIFSKQGLQGADTDALLTKTSEVMSESKFLLRLLSNTSTWLSRRKGLSGKCPAIFYGVEAVLNYVRRSLSAPLPVPSSDSELILDEVKEKDGPSEKAEKEFLTLLSDLLSQILTSLRLKTLGRVKKQSSLSTETEESLFHVMSIASEYLVNNSVASVAMQHLQSPYKEALDGLKEVLPITGTAFPPYCINIFSGDVIPGESYIHAVVSSHMRVEEMSSLKHILGSLLTVYESVLGKFSSCAKGNEKSEMSMTLIPLLLDKGGEFLGDMVGKLADPDVYGKRDGPLNPQLTKLLLSKTLQLICDDKFKSILEPKTLDGFRVSAFKALITMVKQNPKVEVNEEIIKELLLEEKRLVTLLNFLMKTESEGVLIGCCQFLGILLPKISRSSEQDILGAVAGVENIRQLPKHLFGKKFFASEIVMGSVSYFFDGLLNLSSEQEDSPYPTLFKDMLLTTMEVANENFTLGVEAEPKKWGSFAILLKILIQMATASVGAGEEVNGHASVFRQMATWFKAFIQNLDSYLVVKQVKPEVPGPLVPMDVMLHYMLDIGRALQITSPGKETSDFEREGTPTSLPLDYDELDTGTDGIEDDEDESGDDSEDEGLNGKLCTFTITQKEFMTQHWYHCHTCGMTDRVGVCSVCARVCHKGHDVTYSKFGSFFCDCGARTDGGCLALARRPSTTHEFPPSVGGDLLPQPIQVPSREPKQNSEASGRDPPQVDSKPLTAGGSREQVKIRLNETTRLDLVEAFAELSQKLPLETLEEVKKVICRTAAEKTAIGAFLRVQEALQKLRKGKDGELEFRTSEELLLQTLGSQEGAFENIKMQYNGDQGAQIRQLINTQVIRRTIISPLSSPGAKRHFLAVSQEKGKVTILQLGALLGGTETTKKKLSLPRLATLSLPFTALTMATNPIRDDVIVVCGLKDCQVVVMGTAGTIVSQLTIKAQLETQNHIIKPLWLPGSETEIALCTADGVKIFDLFKDTDQPSFHFLLPSGKVRDLTFVVQKECRWIVIMGNDGRIYSEKLDDSTSASNGPYYITNDLNYDDNEILQENVTAGVSEKKSVSIYYSHALGLLFYTYPNGKSYLGTLEDLSAPSPLSRGVLIAPGPGPGKSHSLGLTGWSEILGHPGLIFAMAGNSSPYVLSLTGNGSFIQEIRLPTKLKALDMVPIRHATTPGSSKIKTSLLILCDDGSLRVSNSSDMTDYWLNLRPPNEMVRNAARAGGGSKLLGVNKRMSRYTRLGGGQLLFPADFFEYSSPLDVEFGGNDLLHIYNTAQIKARLENPATYIVSGKSTGFNLEVSLADMSKVITGVRVSVGQQDVARIPSSIQFLGRTISVHPGRPRWYDIPLTREESLTADQKLTLTFGPSIDPASVTIVDCVKIYGKSKDAFAWPEDNDAIGPTESATSVQDSSSALPEKSSEDSLLERVVRGSLDLVEISVRICPKDGPETEKVLDLVTKIYLQNYSPFNSSCRSLMSSLLPNPSSFMDHRDKSIFSHALQQVMTLDAKPSQDVDPEQFTHLLLAIKNIALLRPSHIATYSYTDIGFGPMGVQRVVETLTSTFLRLVEVKPQNPFVVSLDRTGIQRISMVAWALAEILYAVMSSDLVLVSALAPCLISMLGKGPDISIPVKTVFIRRMRPKNVKKRRSTLPLECEGLQTPRPQSHSHTQRVPEPSPPEVDEPIVVLGGQGNEGLPQEMMNALDAYGDEGDDGYAPVIDLQSDAEDEAMVELAIALSLQEQAGGAALAIQGIQQGLQALEDMHQEVLAQQALNQPQEEEEEIEAAPLDGSGLEGGMDVESDATASPPPSDDEASTPPTAPRNPHGGSESSGSSTGGGGSGRRRTRNPAGSGGRHEMSHGEDESAVPHNSASKDEKPSGSGGSFEFPQHPDLATNKPFRIALLRALAARVAICTSAVSLIPILQVALQILSDLDGSTDEETRVVEGLMAALLHLMNMGGLTRQTVWQRTPGTEISLVVLRMLSICVARFRTSDMKAESMWIAKTTARVVTDAGIVPFCKELLYLLRPTWKGGEEEEEKSGVIIPKTLKPAPVSNVPDLHPFFLKQYVKGHATDLLEELPLLLSEMTLRIPYQIKKVMPLGTMFDAEWEQLLCEMLQSRHTPFVRRQARKLLLNIAGTREGYHLLRDLYHIKFHLSAFQKLNGDSKGACKTEFNYSTLVSMVENLNTVIEIASQRPGSWQTFCKSEPILRFLVEVSSKADESLTTAILTLLKIAIDGVTFDSKMESSILKLSDEEKAQKSLAHSIMDSVEKKSFLEFVKKYLLEHGAVSSRWHAHALLLSLFLCSDSPHQLKLVNALWELWPFVPAAGSRAAQFVDILGYATLKNDEVKAGNLRDHVHRLVSSIEEQGSALLAHPNANIYASLVPFVSVDGYYLESEPCGVCYNVDRVYTPQKLATVKADGKYTANHQFIKLTTTLNIVRLSLRLSDIKKARMIKSMGVYYSRKNISIVELKNHRSHWQLAKKVNLTPSQAEVKLDFSVPITAANLILEFSEFYENSSGSCETLQCPRCSASVPASPGVCSNCGENVFQCHKCRAINYDERDPFLCHSCGFCKYAKMDMSLLAKSIVAVDPIENEEDHKKAETAVSSLLEKADTTYRQTQMTKANLETMLQSIKERRSMAGLPMVGLPPLGGAGAQSAQQQQVYIPHHSQLPASYAAILAGSGSGNNNVTLVNLTTGAQASSGLAAHALAAQAAANPPSGTPPPTLRNVQSLAYGYAIDCKGYYEELNRLMSRVGAYRKEMLKLDPSAYPLDTLDNVTCRRCYGCMAASITQSLKLLQALITAGSPRDPFDLSFLSFLLRLSQAAGSTTLKEQIRNALCFFVKDDPLATTQLVDMIVGRVTKALDKESWSDLSFETSEEISLLASLLQMYDSCWEIKLRSLMKVFTRSLKRLRDPHGSETGLLPCLKIIQSFIKGAEQQSDKGVSPLSPVEDVRVNLEEWLKGNPEESFEAWRKRVPKLVKDTKGKKRKVEAGENRKSYLMTKYGRAWRDKFLRLDPASRRLEFNQELGWMKKLLFCPGSIQTRTVTAALLKDLAGIPSRRLKIMELLTDFLQCLPEYSESCHEFMELYRTLATPAEFSAFLNAKGALNIVCGLLEGEIEKLHHRETITLHSDLSQGLAVWELSKLLATLAIPSVCRSKRRSLLSTVLGGYLALKRLRLHRTRPVDEAQEILLSLLEDQVITKGTEEETKVFMSVCVETLRKCPKDDLTTPVFVFERLCSLILHEESDVAEFYVTLDKDPQQEDFLQGRMLGNPYKSSDTGIGPLMRDIKNKVCRDCELVALLEDDNGMELLVNNKIISLDLPVKEVYKRLWVPTNGQLEPMRIVYRMRGLLGDATEEFVETFAAPSDGTEDAETTYKLANVLVASGGLEVVLKSLENVLGVPFVVSRGKPFIAVILKLVGYVAKVKNGRAAFLSPELTSVQTLLPILHLCLEHELTCISGSSGVIVLADQLLEVLDVILSDGFELGLNSEEAFSTFAQSRGSIQDIRKLLLLTDRMKGKPQTLGTLLKVLGCLSFRDKEKMNLIFDYYADSLNFFYFDEDSTPDSSLKLDQFCTLVTSIPIGPFGRSFKDLALERRVIEGCLDYIRHRAPTLEPSLGRPDSDEWKEMVTKPSLKYVLRILGGLATDHEPSQEVLSQLIPVIHQLEQVSSDEHVGSLAENALEALRSHERIWKEVESARRATREEKKRLAMAMRTRQLNAIGMKTNEKGQVTAAGSILLDQMEELGEETGLVCVICREGYKFQPTKALGIYTFTKRIVLNEAESSKGRRTYAYSTVSHFNVVHVDCHMAAIRLARGRDEWESASLQNGNTRCNGLIPLWGPQVPESAFAASLARHNAYLQESTAHRDVGFSSGVQDIKSLLIRFAEEKSFHEDTGGGGPESNMHLIPYLFHTTLYVLNTTRLAQKESAALDKFLAQGPSNWKEDVGAIEGPFYQLVVSIMVYPPAKWVENRVTWLKRILTLGGNRSKRMATAEFSHYRSCLIYFGLIDGLYSVVFKDVSGSGEWPSMVADYIRRHDEALLKSTTELLGIYQQKLLPATSLDEMFVALRMVEEVGDVSKFLDTLWTQAV